MSETVTFWHVAHESYQAGQPLICRAELAAAGDAPEWGWGDDATEGFDPDVVCLFRDTADERDEADALWFSRPTGILLRVELPTEIAENLATVEEGYAAAFDRIDAEYITIIAIGYINGVIGK